MGLKDRAKGPIEHTGPSTLYVSTRREYGQARRYIHQDAVGSAVVRLTGRQTLTSRDEAELAALGVVVRER